MLKRSNASYSSLASDYESLGSTQSSWKASFKKEWAPLSQDEKEEMVENAYEECGGFGRL